MKSLGFSSCALTIAAAALLAACNNRAVPAGPPAVGDRAAQHRRIPSLSAYLYTWDTGVQHIVVRTFPEGKHVRRIAEIGGLCTDPNAGNLYVVEGGGVTEYAPGGSSKITRATFPSDFIGGNCAVDPTTGNVAIPGSTNGRTTEGAVAVYTSLYGSPAIYLDPGVGELGFAGYDPQGNLFADQRFVLAELPHGSSTFTNYTVSLGRGRSLTGTVQWDGSYITAESAYLRPTIYRIVVGPSGATIVGKTRLPRQRSPTFTWIDGNTLISAYTPHGKPARAAYWSYPNPGHAPYRILNVFHPDSIVTGVAPSP